MQENVWNSNKIFAEVVVWSVSKKQQQTSSILRKLAKGMEATRLPHGRFFKAVHEN